MKIEARKFIFMFVFNMLCIYLFLFWMKLNYWLLEGRVPVILLVLAFLFVLLLPIAGNLLFILKSKRHWGKTLLFALLSILLLMLEPFIMPKYTSWVHDYTMHLSFPVLEFFKMHT